MNSLIRICIKSINNTLIFQRSAGITKCLSFKSAISLENIYPKSSLSLTTPQGIGLREDPKEKFNGFIPIDQLEITYSRSSGPGGQNVNTVSTKVDLRFHVQSAQWLTEDLRVKLIEEHKTKINKEGFMIIRSDKTRSQQLNVADAVDRLRTLIREAAEPEGVLSPETEEKLRKSGCNRLSGAMAVMSRSQEYLRLDDPVGIFNSHKLTAIRYTVEWSIGEFESLSSTDKLVTPAFRLGNEDEFEVRLACYPEDGSFYVQLAPADDGRVSGDFRFSLLNRKGEQVHRLGFDMNQNTYREGYGWGINEYVRFCKSFMADTSILVNGRLVVVCEITLGATVIMGVGVKPPPSLPAAVVPHGRRLADDLGLLVASGSFSDVTLVAAGGGDNAHFPAHKAILSARSPVFSRMFGSEMRENALNVVEIADVDADTLTGLLVYLYTDRAPSLNTLGEEMLAAADKYQLDELKATCEGALCSNLTVENATRVFVLADLHRAMLLKAKAIDFINQHKSEVCESAEWRMAKREHPLALVVSFL